MLMWVGLGHKHSPLWTLVGVQYTTKQHYSNTKNAWGSCERGYPVSQVSVSMPEEGVLFKIRDDVDRGFDLSLLLEETTDCTDDHPLNIISGLRCRIRYITSTFIARNDVVNGATVGAAVIAAWKKLNLPRHAVKLVWVDNAGYCAKSFREHLAALFKNSKLRTCWGHSGNWFAAPLEEHPNMTPLCTCMKYMRITHWSILGLVQRRQRYILFVGQKLPGYTDTRWSSACDSSEHHATFLVAELKWLYAGATRNEEKERDKDQTNDHKTVLDRAVAVLEKQHIIVHLQATFSYSFGKPIYKFLIGLQVDIVPEGCADTICRPITHRLYNRVLELEAQLPVYVADFHTVPNVWSCTSCIMLI